eukprot:UN10480
MIFIFGKPLRLFSKRFSYIFSTIFCGLVYCT